MFRHRLLPIAGAVALGLALSAPIAQAAPAATPPTPDPRNATHPHQQHGPRHTAMALPPLHAYQPTTHPTVVARPTITAADLAKVSAGAKALLSDRASGKLTATGFVKNVMDRLNPQANVPARYRSTPSPLELQTLVVLANQDAAHLSAHDRKSLSLPPATGAAPAVTAAPAAAVTWSCAGSGILFPCTIRTAHAVVRWAQTGTLALPADEQTLNADGVPRFPAEVSQNLEQAYATYAAMNLRTPPAPVDVSLNNPLGGATGLSIPSLAGLAPMTFLPARFDAAYLPAHELFHQFQWPYIMSTGEVAATFPLVPAVPVLIANFVKSYQDIQHINWWMEATAEWGAERYRDAYVAAGDPVALPAQNVPVFLETTAKALSYWDGWGGHRQYGAMAAVTWFTQRFGSDFVRASWEQVANDFYIDGQSDIVDTITSYGGDQSQELGQLWDAMYTLCDTFPDYGWDTTRLHDANVKSWCAQYITNTRDLASTDPDPGAGIFRPVHGFVDMSKPGTLSTTVDPGGAAYTDMSLPSTDVGRHLVFTAHVNSPSPGTLHARLIVRSWGGDANKPGTQSPAQWCQEWQQPFTSDGSATVTVQPDRWCPDITITAVNADMTGPSETITVDWASRLTGAVIGNNLISLGVNDSGNLIVDEAVPSASGSYGRGLRYLPTNNDALAPGCWCEGWGVATHDSAPVSAAADADSWGLSGGTVVDFTATATEAWSTVRVGGYLIEHHYHPSSDPRMYQVDVFINADSSVGLLSPPVTYRRVMDFDAEPTAFHEYMTVHVDPADTAITDSTNDGFQYPDPSNPLYDLGARGSFTDFGPADQGAAFDISAPAVSLPSIPSLTLFYGAGSSAADAQAGLAAVGATSYALAKPSSSALDQGTPNTFAFGYKHL